MRTVKIAVFIEQDLLVRLDQLVEEKQFPNRSCAMQEAIRHQFQRLKKSRLARESAKLDPAFEQTLAEGGLLTFPDDSASSAPPSTGTSD